MMAIDSGQLQDMGNKATHQDNAGWRFNDALHSLLQLHVYYTLITCLDVEGV